MSKYAWKITADHLADPGEEPGTNGNAVGIIGPYNANESLIQGEGQRFRMYSDDRELSYEGELFGDFDGLEPLDDFGMPNAGCTMILLLQDKPPKYTDLFHVHDEHGYWVVI